MKRLTAMVFGLCLIVVVSACGQTSEASHETTELTISAASSMTKSLQEVKKTFEDEHPSINITYNFGGSGTLRKQIEQGAPIDMFFSASKRDYEALKDDRLVDDGSAILQNSLDVIMSDQASFTSFEDFYQSDKQMAVGTPVAVPAGTYAKQVLQNMDLWEPLQDRLVFTKDVQHVLTDVSDGAVAAGIVYESDLQRADNVDVLKTIDSSLHSPIEYFAASIQSDDSRSAEKDEAIETFYDYVQNETSMNIFEDYGFQTANEGTD